MKRQKGFTLMELLVVLLIIGLLSTVALRTIDSTRDRALFDQTAKEMKELIYAMVGNPDLTANGRRVDFGFYGDMMRLPNDLDELVKNTTGSPDWKGPYLRREFIQDTIGYRLDAWGNPYTFDPATGTIATIGNGKYPMTMKVVDAVSQLTENYIMGTVTDADNAPPGDKAASIGIYLYLPNGTFYKTPPDPGGYYGFSPQTHGPIPIGNHKIVAYRAGSDSIVKLVTVVPRSKTIVDFRFSKPFRSTLKRVGEPLLTGDSTGFTIKVVNDGIEDVTVNWVTFLDAPDSAYMGLLYIRGNEGERTIQPDPRPGKGDTVSVAPPYTIKADMADEVEFSFYDFRKTPTGGDTCNLFNKVFRLRFNDGSEVRVQLQ